MRSILRERSRAAEARTRAKAMRAALPRAPRYRAVAAWVSASIVLHALVFLALPDVLVRDDPRVEILHVELDTQEASPPRLREVPEPERSATRPPPEREPAPRSASGPQARPRANEPRALRSPPPQRVEPSVPPMPRAAPPAPRPNDVPLASPGAAGEAEPQARTAPENNAPPTPAPAPPSASAPQGAAGAAPAPRMTDARPLSAPVRYRRTAEQGRVTLKVLVSREGRVATAALEKTSGYPNLDRHALEAVTRWRFEPARKGDEAVEQWLVVNVDY